MTDIKLPTNVEEARTMAALGIKWLEDNAPEQLTQHWRDMKAEAVRDFIEYMYNSKDCQLCSNSLDVASKYADSVRRGE